MLASPPGTLRLAIATVAITVLGCPPGTLRAAMAAAVTPGAAFAIAAGKASMRQSHGGLAAAFVLAQSSRRRMGSIFLSYARADLAKAEVIARRLEQAGHTVWWDRHIHAGSRFSSEIDRELKSADLVVVLWSQASVESAWVQDEAGAGRDRGCLVPVLIEAVELPLGFRQYQAIDLSKGFRGSKALQPVLDEIEHKLGNVTERKPPAPISAHRIRRPAQVLIAAALAAVLIGVLWWAVAWRGQSGERAVADGRTPETITVAMLPFATDSADPETRKLAFAAHDSLAYALSQSRFTVKSAKPGQATVEPAADFLMTADVTGSEGKYHVTVRMQETAHDIVIYSHRFEANRDQLSAFPDLIGAQVVGSLGWTPPLIMIDRLHPSGPAILKALFADPGGDLGALQGFETLSRLAEQAPDSAIVQMSLAFNTGLALNEIPRDERAAAVAKARRAADRAQALAPNFGEAYAPWCLLHSRVRMIACEDRLRAGNRVDPGAPFVDYFLSQQLRDVGRFDEALHLAKRSFANDQYVPEKISKMLRMLETDGQTEEAERLYRQGRRWWPDFDGPFIDRVVGMAYRGDFEAIHRLEKAEGAGNLPEDYGPASGFHPAACRQLPEEGFKLGPCMLVLASAGDLDGAYALADRIYLRRVGRNRAEEDRIWLDQPSPTPTAFLASPAAAPMRMDPRFLPLAERVGLLAYWRSGRLPDFCKGSPEPVCSRFARGT